MRLWGSEKNALTTIHVCDQFAKINLIFNLNDGSINNIHSIY